MSKKVAVIVGGLSSEREVSLNTGKAFTRAVEKLGFPFEVIDAREDLPAQLLHKKPDVALLAVHGKMAEDGTVQGICEYLKIPYSGSGILGSALAMDKVMAKQIFAYNGLPTPKYQVIRLNGKKLAEYRVTLPLPFVVKPARDGSSMGITICRSSDGLLPALELAAKYDKIILIEEYISGKEITVPVFRDKPLTSIEIVPKRGYYDYTNKYTAGKTEYFLPARLPAEILLRINELALSAFRVLDCRAYGRVDFRVREDNEPFILEVNTLPGCTETSLVPKAAAHEGIPFEEFIRGLIETARLDYEGVC